MALQRIVCTYTIAFASFILTAGALGDRVGGRRGFITGFAIFTIASLACAVAPRPSILIAARAMQGIGAASLVPNSLAVLNHAYRDEKERAHAVGVWAAGASFSITAGPLVGGALIAAFGWRSIFLINLPVGLAGLWLASRYVGLGVLVPPLTAMLLGSVEKARSGIASGTLNSARPTGSVIGVSLFGSLIGGSAGFVPGAHIAL